MAASTKLQLGFLFLLPIVGLASGASLSSGGAVTYEDKVIHGDALWDDPDAEAGNPYDVDGPARGMYIEGVRTMMHQRQNNYTEDGILFGLRRETEDFGAISLEGALKEGGHSVLTAWQRNLAFDGNWYANNALGMVNTPSMELTRRQYRFFIPTMSMAGGLTEWSHGQQGGTTVFGGVGQPGTYSGIRVPAFYGLPGTVFSAGAQTGFAPNVDAGIQIVGANGTPLNANLSWNMTGPELSTTGALASAAWKGSNVRLQANVLGVESNIYGSGGGGWLDGWYRGESFDHFAGLFRFDPNLLWGNQQLVSNMQGGYYRANYMSRQWQLDGGIDYSTPLAGNASSTVFLTGNGRYQYSRDWGFGSGANIRQGSNNAWSMFSYVSNENTLGSGRAQLNYAESTERNATQLMLDQTWRLQFAGRLGTAINFLRETGGSNNIESRGFSNVGLSIYGGGDLGNNLTLDGNIQWNSNPGGAGSPATYVNASLNWKFLPSWMFRVFAYQNSVSVWQPLTVDSPLTNPNLTETQKWTDSGIFLSLRYDFSAGRGLAPLGGSAGEGGGLVTGIIYFDQNDDGRLNAGEQGVPNLNVVLNGRFVTRTDASGRFEFSRVVAGTHVISVEKDNLPLPWRLQDSGRREFQVNVRGSTLLEIGAQRMR